MPTPNDVIQIVNTKNYGANNIEFWKMLQYLQSDHNGVQIWTHIDSNTFRKMAIHFHESIELLPSFDYVKKNAEIIYKSYMVMMHKIRGKRSVGETMAYEKHETLQSLHNIYKILLTLTTSSIPLFGHVHL